MTYKQIEKMFNDLTYIKYHSKNLTQTQYAIIDNIRWELEQELKQL